MRKFGRVDTNHNEIIEGLRQVGANVQSLASIGGGCPDLLVSFRGEIHLLEVKKDLKATLTPEQIEWHQKWRCSRLHVVSSLDAALIAVGAVHSEKNWKPEHVR